MRARRFITIIAGGALAVLSTPAAAQAAAETAIITSGTGAAQARGAQGLGSAISGAMRRAGNTIRVQPRGAPRARSNQHQTQALPEGDPLEGTDAPAYTLGNGATIRVSGGLRNAPSTRCTANCAADRRSTVITIGTQPKPAKPEAADKSKESATEPD